MTVQEVVFLSLCMDQFKCGCTDRTYILAVSQSNNKW